MAMTTANNKPTTLLTATPTPTKQSGQSTKPQFDPNSPQIREYLNDVSHQFVREGTMVAFPTCLPGVTMPIPLEESRITAIDINSDGHIYGGTSCSGKAGARIHLFAAAFHNLTSVVLEVTTPPDGSSDALKGATECVAVCCCEVRKWRDEDSEESQKASRAWPGAVAFVNGSGKSNAAGRAIFVPHVDLAQDWIQEWGMEPQYVRDLGECVAGEPVVHAVALHEGRRIVGLTSRHLFTLEVATGKISIAGEVPGTGRLALGQYYVWGLDDGGKLWSYDIATGKLKRGAANLPDGDWVNSAAVRWANNKKWGDLMIADAGGRIFSFNERNGSFTQIAQTHLAPVQAMALAPDGRIFGGCGDEIANLFVCDRSSAGDNAGGSTEIPVAPPVGRSPGTASARNLGVAASTLENRRYMYQFGDAAVGRDGEIIFAENDNGGHLWLYFPRLGQSFRFATSE
jgi:hypothetical protein